MQDHAKADRLYIVTRADLPIGLQAAQSAHAAFEFTKEHWELAAPWMRDSNFIVLVTVPDEPALLDLASAAMRAHAQVTVNHEPDLDHEATAIVVAPGPAARRLCSQLPLVGRELAVT